MRFCAMLLIAVAQAPAAAAARLCEGGEAFRMCLLAGAA